MTKNSDSSKQLEKNIDFSLLEKLFSKIKNQRDKEILNLILKKALKTKEIEQKTGLSGRRIQQIVIQHTTELFGIKLLPKDIRRMSIKNYSKNNSLRKTKKFSKLKQLRKKDYLIQEQVDKLFSQIKNKEHKLIIKTLLETGCSLTEITNIKTDEVYKNYIIINKRKTPISKILSEKLRRQKSEFVFYTRQSPKISDKRVFQIVTEYARKSGLHISPQTLRNTFILNALEKGTSEREIQTQTGIKHLGLNHYGIGGVTK